MSHIFLEKVIKSRLKIRLVACGILEMRCQSKEGILSLASVICLRDLQWWAWIVKRAICFLNILFKFFIYL